MGVGHDHGTGPLTIAVGPGEKGRHVSKGNDGTDLLAIAVCPEGMPIVGSGVALHHQYQVILIPPNVARLGHRVAAHPLIPVDHKLELVPPHLSTAGSSLSSSKHLAFTPCWRRRISSVAHHSISRTHIAPLRTHTACRLAHDGCETPQRYPGLSQKITPYQHRAQNLKMVHTISPPPPRSFRKHLITSKSTRSLDSSNPLLYTAT